jgi:predicted N-acyltransferase
MAYYLKWLTAVPFSPVTGPRLCLLPQAVAPDLAREQLLRWLQQQTAEQGISSWHLLFCAVEEAEGWQRLGADIRVGCQFHWRNRGYQSFTDFLAGFVARKRKSVNRERRLVAESGVRCERNTGVDMTQQDWQLFYRFYAATYYKRGHQPHLTLAFFELLAQAMPDAILVDWAWRNGERIAAALFLVGADTLYGRYWGTLHEVPGLHFEVCFYRGIEYCIAHGLQRFDPGAQGEHKISRGFEPVITYSCHWIADPAFRSAISAFVQEEQVYVQQYREQATQLLPFRCATDTVGQ